LAGHVTHAKPTDSLAMNGFIYGAAGALTLRADFRPRRQAATKVPQAIDQQAATSILAVGLAWAEEALNEISERRIKAWHSGLNDDCLVGQAFDIYSQIKQDQVTPIRARKQTMALIVDVMDQVRSKDEEVHLEGRAYLINFCTTYVLKQHNPRPIRLRKKKIPPGVTAISPQAA